MEDLEFSVEICERDWQHFFEMCEECDLHPPSLATADDSGLSDCDHTKSTLAESAQEVYLTRRYSLDAISNCKDLVMETQLGEQAAGEMESILSGSEEDIHLQSVNMFFERMTNQANVGKSKESKREDGLCSNGMEPGSKQSVGDETIFVNENDLDKMNTFKKVRPSSYTLHGLPACSAQLKNDGSTHTESFIGIQTQTKTNDTNPHKPDDSFNLHKSQQGTVSTKEASGPPSSLAMATMKRKRRKKRCHGIESTQSRHQRSNDEEQSLSRFYRNIKLLYSNEPQKTDALVATMVPCGGTCERRFRCRDSEHNDELTRLQCFHHPDCEDQFNLEDRRLQVQATSEGADWDDGDVMDGGQGDTLSAAKSVQAAEALHSGRDKGTGCQRQAETQQQLEMEADNLDQNSHEFLFTSDAQNSTFPNTELQKCKITVSSVDETVSEVTCAQLTANFTELLAHKKHLSERPSSLALTETEYHVDNHKCDDEDREISSFVGPFSDNKKRETNPELPSFEDTGPALSLSNVNIAGSCSCPSPDPDPVNRCGSIMLTHQEEPHGTGQTKDFKAEDDDVISTSREPEYVPDSKDPVFVMSSFWSEMEKLTINDIMGLRKTNKETDESNPSLSSQSVESKTLPAGEDTNGDFDAVPSNPDSTSSKRVLLWEKEPVDIITEKAEEAPFSGSPRHGNPPQGLRRISKNTSVHNLRALDSLEPCSKAKTAHILQTLEELEVKEVKKHSLDSTHCKSFSLHDVFQFLLGGKQQIHSQSAKDDIVNFNTDGKSVPETYDHFFAEFGIENFFYPFITEEKHTKARSVTSGQTKMHLAEAYDYFFACSSSDDSAGEEEEEEEESGSPVRVVSRLSQNSKNTQTFTDDYENFFCDSDTRENFFWTATFSFRNFHLSRGAVWNKRSTPSSLGHAGRNVQNAATLRDLGHTGFTHLLSQQRENRITRSILTQLFGYEDMQRALPNPRTDVSLLRLRQSDMCLVCIAFASWVLKTANPQVGDMWKAVLLANLSALSAIRYLRKDVKVEMAAGQKKQHLTTLSGT
ncbi:PGC-1 and ERR-induced regulator in muscle protein 1 [Hippocampus zosterae]|uniref:PGC-1 and ERR-induced regulator in muscle protein 1 n=1 Tax=Hippocampus zosterae TaxID=109293 RepID=UPI00223E4B79|nr:PGC-1 and ERR-induced regulator in muscle protein 1 [Hippocampus zosterae]